MMSVNGVEVVKQNFNVFVEIGKRFEQSPDEKGRQFFGTTASLTTREKRPLRSGAAGRVGKALKA